jgi:hypothetical protein
MPIAARKRGGTPRTRAAKTAKIIDFESLLKTRAMKTKPPNKAFEQYTEGLGKKQKNPAKSFEQLRQRELAWALYITDGYCANLLHALTVNCVTFTDRDKALIGKILANVESDAEKIRAWIKQL